MQNQEPIAIDLSKEDAILQILPRAPLLSSHRAGWKNIHLEYHRQPVHEMPINYPMQHLVVIHNNIKYPLLRSRKLDSELQNEQVREGDICVIPANTLHWTHWNKEHDFMLLSFEPTLFARTAYESIELNGVELVPQFSKSDPLIYQIGLALKAEIQSDGFGSRIYIDSLVNTLTVHLLKYYSVKKTEIKEYLGGLPKYKLQQVIDYINDNLEHDLSLGAIASLISMSPHYFASLFKQSIGLAPHQYVTCCRIDRAKQLLANRNLAISEIAQQVGFQNQSHFTTVFRKHIGVTPKVYRQR